jgi:imidazolonepropionase-like amidohydrolase
VREPTHAPALALGLVGLLLSGASASLPADGRSGPDVMVLRAAGYVDVERGRVVRPAEVVVRGERIVAVRPRTEPPAAGSRVLDLGPAILLPGLIDTHVHLTLGGPASANALATLDAGFTTVQDLGSLDYAALGLRDSIAAGRLPGPRVIASGPGSGSAAASATSRASECADRTPSPAGCGRTSSVERISSRSVSPAGWRMASRIPTMWSPPTRS